ncbi:Cytoskeleton assembly control protein [Balamuthia mandrillaris]
MLGVSGRIAGREGFGGQHAQLISVSDLATAIAAANQIVSQFENPALAISDGAGMALADALAALEASATQFIAAAPAGGPEADARAKALYQNLRDLIAAAKHEASLAGDDVSLLDGAKALSDSVAKLFQAASELAKNPNSPQAMEAFRAAQLGLRSAATYINAAAAGTLADQPSQQLILESAKMVAAASSALVGEAKFLAQGIQDPQRKQRAIVGCQQVAVSAAGVLTTTTAITPAILNPECQNQVATVCRALESANQQLLDAMAASGLDEYSLANLRAAAKVVGDAIAQLMDSSTCAGQRGNEPQDFLTPVQTIRTNVENLTSNARKDPKIINPASVAIQEAVNQVLQATKVVATTADPQSRNSLLLAAKTLADACAKLVSSCRQASANPNDSYSMGQVESSAAALEAAAQALLNDGKSAVMESVRYWAKAAAASSAALIATSTSSASGARNEETKKSLLEAARTAAGALAELVNSIRYANDFHTDGTAQEHLLAAGKQSAPPLANLVATSKRSIPHIADLAKKTSLNSAADEAAAALQKLMVATQAISTAGPTKEVGEALEQITYMAADLEAAAFAAEAGTLPKFPGQNADSALDLLDFAAKSLQESIPPLEEAALNTPDDVGPAAKNTAGATYQVVNAAKTLTSYVPDSSTQKSIIAASKNLCARSSDLIEGANKLSHNPTNMEMRNKLTSLGQDLTNTLASLVNIARGIDTKDLDEAATMLSNEGNRIKFSPGSSGDFPAKADQLVVAARSYAASVQNVTVTAESNPKGLVPAAKMASAAVSPFVNAAIAAASSCPDPEATEKLVATAKEMAHQGAKVIELAKISATTGGASSKGNLLAAANSVSRLLQEMLDALGSAQPGQKQIKEALNLLARALEKLDRGVPSEERPLNELPTALQALGEATSGIVTCARTSPDKLGSLSLRAVNAVDQAVDVSNTAASNSGQASAVPRQFAGATIQAAHALDELRAADNTKKVVMACKGLTQAATAIVAQAKATATSNNVDPTQRRNTILATEKLATSAASLARSARSGVAPHQIDAGFAALRDFKLAVSTGGDAATDQLLSSTRSLVEATQRVLSASADVCGNPKNNTAQMKLSSAANNMPIAIEALEHAATALSPGVKECDNAIEALENCIGELASAGIAATFGQLEGTPGKTHQDCQHELGVLMRDIAADIKQLSDPAASQQRPAAATSTERHVPHLVGLIKSAAATTSNKDTQRSLIILGKELAESMLGLLRTVRESAAGKGSPADVANKSKEANQALLNFANSLKSGVSNMRDIEEALRLVSEAALAFDQPLSPASRPYKECKVELNIHTQELVKKLSNLVNSSKLNVDDLGAASKAVAALVPVVVAAVREASSSTTDGQARAALTSEGRAAVTASAKLLEGAKNVANDPKNRTHHQTMGSAFAGVTSAITRLLDACYAGATGERECEDAVYQLGRVVADLDASSLFAAAGQVDPNELAPGMTWEQCQNALISNAKDMQEASKAFASSVQASQDQLGRTAKALGVLGMELARFTKATGALGGDKVAQQKLIDACKDSQRAAQDLLSIGKDAHGKGQEPLVQQVLRDSLQSTAGAISTLIEVAQTAAAQSARGIMEIDKAKGAIKDILSKYDSPQFQGDSSADAERVVSAARSVAASTGELVVGCGNSQEELMAACESTSAAVNELLLCAKGGGKTTQELEVRKKLDAAAKLTAECAVRLLESCKSASKEKNLQSQAAVSSLARECADHLLEVVAAANLLPGGQGLTLEEDTGEDLEELAEKELRACAQVIENSAKILMDRPRKEVFEPGELEVTEAIIEAARAITQATASLVRGAHVAQKERVAKGKNPKTKHLYRKDPTWANGLISAAQTVAATTQELVRNANDSAQGKCEEERLIASARAVAAATAQLVAASRAKADPTSQSQKTLSAAAKAVAAATSRLVEAAKAAAEAEKEESSNKRLSLTPSAKADLEKQIEILRLEKQLEQARMELAKGRQQQYRGQ